MKLVKPQGSHRFKQNSTESCCASILRLQALHTTRKLDVYIEGQFGVCAQKALTAAALLELLKGDGFLTGGISYDWNVMKDDEGKPKNSGHAWARLDSSTGTTWIIDTAQDFVGTMRESFQRHKATWPYARPSDLVRLKITPKRAQQFKADLGSRNEALAGLEKLAATYSAQP